MVDHGADPDDSTERDTYDLEPAAEPPSGSDPEPNPELELELELEMAVGGHPEADTPEVESTEIPLDPTGEDRRCVRCGAPLPEDPRTTRCLSCGFDPEDPATDVRRSDSQTSPESESESESESGPKSGPASSASAGAAEEAGPMAVATSWRPQLMVAGVALATVSLAMIAGWSSFYPRSEGRFLDADGQAVLDAPRLALRFAAVVKLLVATAVLVACGLVATGATALLEGRPVGARAGLAARLTLAVALAALVRLVPVESQALQNVVHLVLGLAVVAATTVLTLGLRGRVAGVMLLAWTLALLLAVPLSRLVVWAIPVF